MDISDTPNVGFEAQAKLSVMPLLSRDRWRWGLLLLIVFALGGCDRSTDGDASTADAASSVEESIPVRTVMVVSGDVTRTMTATTTLSPKTSVRIVAEVSGTIRAWNADTGDTVENSEILAAIEIPEVDVQLREARLNLARVTREVSAIEPLRSDGYLSQQAWEDALSQRDAARAALDRLQEQSRRQHVRSPLDGVVLERAVERGETVSAGSLLYHVANLSELVADIAVPERELAAIEVGMSADLQIPAASGGPVHGTITRIAPVVDQTTGTVSVRIAVAGHEGTRLRPGMFTTVKIATETHASVPTLPARAIIEEGDRRSVFVVRRANSDGAEPTVERADVTLGLRQDETQEITAGLEVGAEVVLVGQSRLREGATVRVANDGGS